MDDQLQKLKEKFGTNLDYIDVIVPMTYNEVLEFFGEPCEEYEPLCACCIAWLEWNKTNKVTVTVSRQEIINILRN